MIRTSLFIGTPDMPEVAYVHLFRDPIPQNVARAANLGFDGVELLIGDPATFDGDELAQALQANGISLACLNTGRMVSQFGLTLIHPDKQIMARAFVKLQELVKICHRFGCALNIGLFRGGALDGKPISYSKSLFVEVLQAACDEARPYGVTINFEPTNRFEINFIHTTDEGLEIVRQADRPNLGLLLDLYHMYIEDTDISESILKAREHVRHLHFSDSDRWPAGVSHGVIDFPATVALLKRIGYSGYLSEGLVRTADVDGCARQTAAYLKKLIAQP
jgi:sugar phosphate isomerase/epimerase